MASLSKQNLKQTQDIRDLKPLAGIKVVTKKIAVLIGYLQRKWV